MIKIQISNIVSLKADYLVTIKPQVLSDLEQLSLTLGHLQNANQINLAHVSRRCSANALVIKDILELKGFEAKPFIKKNYRASALLIQDAPDRDTIANFMNLAALLDHLLVNDQILDVLLVGTADQLMSINDNLLQQFSITQQGELDILKLGFRYWDDKAAGIPIKDFFKAKQLTTFCPYCNIEKAVFTLNPVNQQPVYRFDLDHFYDKARYPLLATSLFNLVPAGQACNQVNKGAAQFTDRYHLNPYLGGFGRYMVFVPQLDPLQMTVTSILLKMKDVLPIERYEKIMGTGLHNVERLGNANAFQLQTKYDELDIREDASSLLENIRSTINNLPSLEQLLTAADGNDHINNIQKWFERISYSKFFPKDFGKKAKSKFHRDLLDHYCSTLNSHEVLHTQVFKILEDSYLAGNGGE